MPGEDKKQVCGLLLAAFSIIGELIWVGCKNNPRRLNVCQVQGVGAVSPYLEREVDLTGIIGWVAEDPYLQGFILIDESSPRSPGGCLFPWRQPRTW